MSNCIDNSADSCSEPILKSLKDHISSLENQLRHKQYITEKLLRKSYQSSGDHAINNSNLI